MSILKIGATKSFQSVIDSETRSTYIKGTITKEDGSVIDVTNDIITPGSLYTTNSCVNGESFEIGAVFAAELGVALKLNGDRNSLYNAKVELSYFVEADDTVYQVRLGEYFVSEVARKGKSISIKAYDRMLWFDKEIDESFRGTIQEALSHISEKCGVPIAYEPKIDLSTLFVNGGLIVEFGPGTARTYREVLSQICKLTFTFGVISNGGAFTLCEYTDHSVKTITPKIKRSSSVSDFTVSYSQIKGSFLVGETETEVFYKTYSASDDSSGLTYDLGDINIFRGDDASNQAVFDVLFEKLKMINYIPCEISFIGDPTLELGDKVTNVDMDGVETEFYITSYKWTYRGDHTIKGAGSDPMLSSVKDKADHVAEKTKELNNLFMAKVIEAENSVNIIASKTTELATSFSDLKVSSEGVEQRVKDVSRVANEAHETAINLAERVTNAESEIKQTAEEISLVVREEVVGTLGELDIGARNYVLNSSIENEPLDEPGGFGSYEVSYSLSEALKEVKECSMTLSFDIKKKIDGECDITFELASPAGDVSVGYCTLNDVGTEYERKTFVFDCNDELANVSLVNFYSSSGLFCVKNVKLEKGMVSTDWTPAPEEYEERLSKAEASIKQNADNIELKVGVDDVISSINISKEEVKIDADKITLQGKTIADEFTATNITIEGNSKFQGEVICNDKITIKELSGSDDSFASIGLSQYDLGSFSYMWNKDEGKIGTSSSTFLTDAFIIDAKNGLVKEGNMRGEGIFATELSAGKASIVEGIISKAYAKTLTTESTINSGGNIYLNANAEGIFTGGKTVYNDGKTGALINNKGRMYLTGASNATSGIFFYPTTENASSGASIQYDATNDYLQFVAATMYTFGNTVRVPNNVAFVGLNNAGTQRVNMAWISDSDNLILGGGTYSPNQIRLRPGSRYSVFVESALVTTGSVLTNGKTGYGDGAVGCDLSNNGRLYMQGGDSTPGIFFYHGGQTSAGANITYDSSTDKVNIGSSSGLTVGGTAVSLSGHEHGWTKVTPTKGSTTTFSSDTYCAYNTALNMGFVRLSVTIKPTADVTAGSSITVSTIPESARPVYICALASAVSSTNARRWSCALNANGTINVRPSTALTKDTEYILYICGTYPVTV